MMLSEQDRANRKFEVENAIANQRLAGVEVSEATVTDLYSYAEGKMDLTTVLARAIAQASTDDFGAQRDV
jgi:Antitoxin VbhA